MDVARIQVGSKPSVDRPEHELWKTLRRGHPVTIHSTEEACRAAGYVFILPKFWMLHVWLFRPIPEGVFSHDNSTIKGPPDVSVGGALK